MRSKNLFLRIPCALWKRLLLWDKRSGLTCLPTNGTKKMLFQPKSQNCSCDWDVIMIKMKEKSTALFIGIRWDRDCEMRSWSMEAQNSRTWIWYISWRSHKIRFQCCMSFKDKKNHRGSSFDCTSILKSRLVAGGRTSKDGRQAVFFTPLNPKFENEQGEILTCDELHETKNGTLSKQMKNFSGLCLLGQFSQSTRRMITILADTVECHCCIQFCTIRMHLQGDFSKWRTSFIRETRDASTSTKSCTQKFLANAAATQDTSGSVSGRNWKESAQILVKEEMKRNRRVLSQQETVAEWCDKHHPCWRKAWILSRPQNRRTCSRCNLEGWRANGPNARCRGKTEDRLIHEIYSGRSDTTTKLHELQRGIHTHHIWTGQPRVVRIRTNVQHHPMPIVQQTYVGRTKNSEHAEYASDQTKIQSEKLKHDLKPWLCHTNFARINRSRGKKCDESQWQRDHWKAKDATRAAIKFCKDTITIRWQQDEQYRESQMAHRLTEEYFKYLDFTSTRLIWTTRPRGNKDTDTKVLLHWPWPQKIVNADPLMLSSVFNKNKEDKIPTLRKMRDQSKDHSTKNCKRNWNGWVKIEWLISRNLLPLHHLHKIGGNMNTNIKTLNGMNTKTLNGEITNGKIMIGLKI